MATLDELTITTARLGQVVENTDQELTLWIRRPDGTWEEYSPSAEYRFVPKEGQPGHYWLVRQEPSTAGPQEG